MKYMLDTNTLIYYFKGMGDVKQNMLSHSPQDILLPAVVLYEIETGLAKSDNPDKRRGQLAELLAVIQLVEFGEAEARAAAQVRAQLELAGESIGPMDNLIAGSALAAGAVLVTRNVGEFERVAGLQVENWF
ncbi:MAG: type II toxin-antitoxin system VapC family toxin [Thiolinea sp.]